MGISRSIMRLALAILTVCISLVLSSASTAFAASPYRLDPGLSLSGGCTPTTLDPQPDPECPGSNHPSKPFKSPRSIATDFYGDIYVASYGTEAADGEEGRIDVFSPQGIFITELNDKEGPKDLVVDSEGNLYVYNVNEAVEQLVRYAPEAYNPLVGEIVYPKTSVPISEGGSLNSLSITPSNDHLYFKRGRSITVYGSAEEGNKELESIGEGILESDDGLGLAIDEVHNRIYAGNNHTVSIFELESPHTLLDTIEGEDVPAGELTGFVALAADEATGRFFLFDGSAKKKGLRI